MITNAFCYAWYLFNSNIIVWVFFFGFHLMLVHGESFKANWFLVQSFIAIKN